MGGSQTRVSECLHSAMLSAAQHGVLQCQQTVVYSEASEELQNRAQATVQICSQTTVRRSAAKLWQRQEVASWVVLIIVNNKIMILLVIYCIYLILLLLVILSFK